MSASQTEVSTRVSVSGTQAVEADVKKLRALTDQLSAAGQRSVAIQQRIAERQKGVANSASLAAKNLDFMSGKAAGLTRGLAALSPVLGDGAVKLAGFSSTVGDVAGLAADAGPRLENLRKSLMSVNSQGTLVESSMSKLVPTMGQLGVAAGAVGATLLVMKGVVEPLMQDFNSLTNAASELQNEFERSPVAMKLIEKAYASTGTLYRSAAEASRAMANARKTEIAALKELDAAIKKGDVSTQQQIDRLLTFRDQLSDMSDAQLTRYRDMLNQAAEAVKKNGEALDETTVGVLKRLDAMLAEEESLKRSTERFERQSVALYGNVDAQRALADEMRHVHNVVALSKKGQSALYEAIVEAQEGAEELGTALDEGLNAQLERLGVNAETAKEALEAMSGSASGVIDYLKMSASAVGAAVTADYAKAVEERKRKDEEWLKAQEEKQKAAIKGAVDDYKKRWGVAVDEAVVYFDTQFGNAHVSLIERVKPLLAAWGKAFGKGGSMAPKGASSGGTMRSGSGGGGDDGGGGNDGEARAMQLERLRKRLKQMTDESSMIRKHFSRGGAYEEVMKKRAAAIQSVKDQIDAIEGKGRGGAGRSAAGTFARLTADNGKSTEQLREERNWRQEQRQQQRQTNSHLGNIASAARQQVDLSKAQVNGTADVKDLLMRSGATEEESARLLAGMAKQTRVPDAFAAVSSRVTPGKGSGSSSGKSTGRSSGGLGGERAG